MTISFLEQCCILKGGLSCIYNNFNSSSNYGIQLNDFILDKIAENEKYDQIYCINLDRTEDHFLPFKRKYSNIIYKSLSFPVISQDCQDIKVLLQQQMLNLLREIQTIINQKKEHQQRNEDQNSRIGIVIYSLSEIVLCLGENWTLRWLRQLDEIISPPLDAPLHGPKTEPFLSIIFLLHTSLHLPTFVSELQTIIPTSLLITPNSNGIFGPTIFCTVKVIRPSLASIKVTEGIDFFSKGVHSTPNSNWIPLIHVGTNNLQNVYGLTEDSQLSNSSSNKTIDNDNNLTNTKISLGQISESITSTTSSSISSIPTTVAPIESTSNTQSGKQSFVILNQHDDDDEDLDDDPDADLDL